ncbi:MAG: hypothetical protein R3314_03385 [Longimicrobiales bacterium]|nr:hypothetical protein [Longimicrobiales bacterium]
MVRRRSFLVEVFAGLNLAFLAVDIWVAHSVNEFGHWAEWIPFWFTLVGALALLANLVVSAPLRSGVRGFKEGAGLWVGVAVGALSILVGVAGLLFHLESDFFQVRTLRSLVYSAPFVAPLAFAGIGLLVLLNRTVPGGTREWGRWVLLLAWGGFVGNFVLSLVDHAQNGFFFATEWVPVIVAGVVVGWLILPVFWRVPAAYLRGAGVLLLVAGLVGVAGFVLHMAPVLTESEGTLWGRLVYGAPPFAPLLFTDLAVLAGLAVWDLSAKGWVSDPAR